LQDANGVAQTTEQRPARHGQCLDLQGKGPPAGAGAETREGRLKNFACARCHAPASCTTAFPRPVLNFLPVFFVSAMPLPPRACVRTSDEEQENQEVRPDGQCHTAVSPWRHPRLQSFRTAARSIQILSPEQI
jgi:hypothetical protein